MRREAGEGAERVYGRRPEPPIEAEPEVGTRESRRQELQRCNTKAVVQGACVENLMRCAVVEQMKSWCMCVLRDVVTAAAQESKKRRVDWALPRPGQQGGRAGRGQAGRRVAPRRGRRARSPAGGETAKSRSSRALSEAAGGAPRHPATPARRQQRRKSKRDKHVGVIN